MTGGKLTTTLQSLFRPQSVAVIGASRTPGKQGHAVVRNLLRCGFSGSIFPVNPDALIVVSAGEAR